MLLFLPRSSACALGLLLLVLAAQGARADACSKPVTMATGHWEPYGYCGANNRYSGLDADLVGAIFEEAGCQLVTLAPTPAARSLYAFERGAVDLVAGASRTAEREKLAHFSLSYRDETVGMCALAEQAARFRTIRSFSDFPGTGLSLVAPRAGWYGVQFEPQAALLHKARRLSRFGDIEQGIRMLAAGRVDFLPGDAAGAGHAAARAGVKLEALPFWLVDAPVHLMINRATVPAADVARIDAAIARLHKRGVLAQIRHAYGAR